MKRRDVEISSGRVVEREVEMQHCENVWMYHTVEVKAGLICGTNVSFSKDERMVENGIVAEE